MHQLQVEIIKRKMVFIYYKDAFNLNLFFFLCFIVSLQLSEFRLEPKSKQIKSIMSRVFVGK